MKKIIYFVIAAIAMGVGASCADDETQVTWEQYADWRQTNIAWLEQQQARTNPDGTPYYEIVTPSWYSGAYVLMHRFGESNTQNLRPLSSSTVDVIYQGFNCDGERFDSSLSQTVYGPAVMRFKLNEVIDGWTAAIETMHVGDSAEIICPYNMAYGERYVSSYILPYSALRFNVRLVDIYAYEKN
ncbi:MAG: FKBP-type peptidyl-prolyl cis-trans isomerase [Muribaculaceae bacterium]|nr:FKBP-type peptidyl-prolyl cis-trans isomerase [Muribaculaceae bacterium]MDE6486581.1 FKBP-type peptidyl-prolyl cis-trans isomerase [Muribaculaceae bacterium]